MIQPVLADDAWDACDMGCGERTSAGCSAPGRRPAPARYQCRTGPVSTWTKSGPW